MSNGLADLSGPQIFSFTITTAMASATTDDETVICEVGKDTPASATGIQLVSARLIPNAAITANGTNFSVATIRNRTAAFAGAALPFSRSWVATNSVQGVAEAMTASATAADLLCANGDVLTLQRIHTASGVVLPIMHFSFTYTLR
jgi:hypothetical protein